MRTRRLASLSAGLAILSAAAACTGPTDDDGPAENGGACPVELELDGATFMAAPEHETLKMGASLPSAGFTACYDGTPDGGKSVPTKRLSGVDEATAFAAKLGNEWTLFVSEGVEDPCGVRYVRC